MYIITRITRKPLRECIYLRVGQMSFFWASRGIAVERVARSLGVGRSIPSTHFERNLCSLMNIEQPFIFCIDVYWFINLRISEGSFNWWEKLISIIFYLINNDYLSMIIYYVLNFILHRCRLIIKEIKQDFLGLVSSKELF